jgi:hypothetical protein
MANETITQEVLLRFKAETSGLTKGARDGQLAMGTLGGSVTKTANQTVELNTGLGKIGMISSALPGKLGPLSGAVGGVARAFGAADKTLLGFAVAGAGALGLAIKFGPVLINLASDVLGAVQSWDDYKAALGRVREEQAKFIVSTQALEDRLDKAGASRRKRMFDEADLEKRAEDKRDLIIGMGEKERSVAALTLGKDTTAFIDFRDDSIKNQERRLRLLDEYTAALKRNFDVEDDAPPPRVPSGGGEGGGRIGRRGGRRGRGIDLSDVDLTADPTPGRFDPVGRLEAGAIPDVDAPPGLINMDALRGEQRELGDLFAMMGSDLSEFEDAMLVVGDAVTGAFEAWGSGAESLGTALKKALGGALRDILMGESKKHIALGVANTTVGNPFGGAAHFAAAAGLATAAGAIGSFLGASGGGGGGGGSGARGAGAGGAGGSGVNTTRIVVVDSPFDDRSQRERTREVGDAIYRANRSERN